MLTVTSTSGFNVGDTIVIRDNNSVAITRLVAAIENATQIRVTAALVAGYTIDQSAFVAKGPTTELPTGADRRAGVYTMTGLIGTTQTNFRVGRVSLYGQGSDSFRTMKSNLAVDVEGDINTGFLGNNLTDSGNTWVDVKDNVVGNWQPLDSIAVGGATNQLADNEFSSMRMGGTDDANQMPVWTGLLTAGGRNALPTPNMEVAEIGTIPLTDIYNSNFNAGSSLFSSNYNNSSVWTIFGDGANNEVSDMVYFGDRGNNMFYSLEFNLGITMVANASYVWEFWNGSAWQGFTPRDAYRYEPRTDYCMPLSANTIRNSFTLTVPEGGTNFGLDQIVAISDNDSPRIFRRLGTSAPSSTTLTFSEPLPAGYDTAQGARVCRLSGGRWIAFDPANIFTANTGRRILSWTPSNLGNAPARTTVNGVNAFWVRARISTLTSWEVNPANQTTPVSMSGLERISSGAITMSSGVQEAKITEITPGSLYNPNEQWTLEYGNSPGWIETIRGAAVGPLSAPYLHRVSGGVLNFSPTNVQNWSVHNSNVPLGTTDYTMSALVRMDMPADATSRRLGLLMRQSLDGDGYAALITKTASVNTVQWWTTLAGVPTAIGSATSKTFDVDTWYCLKAEVIGTTLRAKFWATTDCAVGEPGPWDVTVINTTYTNGRIGLYTGSATASQGARAMFDQVSVIGGANFSDNFSDTQTWRVEGSIQGLIGAATPGTPFASNFINFTIKHRGGWNGVVSPEIGDKIYLTSTAIRSYRGLDPSVPIVTNNNNTKYEVWDFEWTGSAYAVTGSASGAAGTAIPGLTYTAPNNQISLRINPGAPTATRFGNRMLLLQDNLLRSNGSWTGVNGIGSAALFYPSYTLTGSPVATRYNIEGQSGTANARQRGTIDFWFKTNYEGSPSSVTNSEGMYLIDYANQGNTDRLFVRHTSEGFLEASIWAGATQGPILRQSFSAEAGRWYHFRLVWSEDATPTIHRRAWLDGTPFSINQGSSLAARGINAGLIRIGNNWTYNAAFDGAIDELAIFDEDLDTSGACNWGSFTVPASPWLGAETIGCAADRSGINIFRASFDSAMNPQEGFIWADYAYGNPAVIFTNGADTGNERFRIITYPERTRVWIDNTGEKYTPSARIKYGSGHLENNALTTLAGWSHNFTFHHKAARDSETNPTHSPVLNLRRSIHIWSEENFTYTGATTGAPINSGLGFGLTAVGLSGLANMNISHLSMENQFSNFSIMTNPFTSIRPFPSQVISKSVFYNYFDRAYTVSAKTQGSNYVGAYFVTTNFAAANIGTGYNASASQNVGIDGSIFMGHRNSFVTVPPAAANGAAAFFSGRLYTIRNSEFHNNGISGSGTTGALNFSAGVAKLTIENNIFSINTNGVRLYGNSFVDLANNVFDGHVSDDVITVAGGYGSGIRSAQSFSSVFVRDTGSVLGRGLWNEADINLPPNTATFEAESMLQFIGEGTSLFSPILFGTVDYLNMGRVPEEYFHTTIPGTEIRLGSGKDIVNLTTFGNMRTTGGGLSDTTVRTSGGYAWRLDPRSSDVALDYTAKVVGVAGKPLAVTGYLRINEDYGSSGLPTVTLSGLGMAGPNLTWTAQASSNVWQQFVVSGTPTESALAEVKISVSLEGVVVADSGTSQIIANPIGNYLPALVEDVNKSWRPNQWVGFLMRDSNGKIFEIVRNTGQLLYVKGIVAPHLLSTTFTAATPGDYIIFRQPMVYLDDVSVLSGTVDTGTLDLHIAGQPVSPWLATGLTAESVWSAQYGVFADITGSFGQLMQDALVARYANVLDPSPTTISFNTNLTASADDFYNEGVIIFTEGQNRGVVRRISAYGGASKTITIAPPLPFAPKNGDRFAVLAATSFSAGGTGGASAAEIWNYAVRSLTDATLNSGSLATSFDIAAIQSSLTTILSQTNNIVAIKTKTDTINWADIIGLITTTGQIRAKTDTINWSDISAVKTRTDTINWNDVTGIKLNTDTIVWGDITAIRNNVATLISEIGVGNIAAIRTKAETISWGDITGLVTTSGQIKEKTDTINWANVVAIKTKTDTIAWDDVTGIKVKTDTIAWGDIGVLQSSINSLNNISATDIWAYATRTITGEVVLTADSRRAIWDTACAILNTSGSVGKQVCDNLDTTISSRSTLTAAQVWAEATRTITALESPALAAIANNVWSNATRALTYYGNDITAQQVWSVLTSSLTTIDSIGKLLVTNVDETISSRSSQESLDVLSENVATTSALIDAPISSRAAQSSLDDHEAAESAFRTQTTNTLGSMTINIAAILTQLSNIETKINTIQSTLAVMDGKLNIIDANVTSVKTTIEDTNIKVTAMQTVTNNILAKWGSYNATTILGYVDALEANLGDPNDPTSSATVFGKLNYLKQSGAGGGAGGGGGGMIDLVYAQAQSTHTKLLEVQTELGFNGKSTNAYDEMIAVKGYVNEIELSLSTLDLNTSAITASVTNVSNDLRAVTNKIGKVNVDSLAPLFEVQRMDIDYLKTKMVELKTVADINRQLLEKTVNQPIVKVIMEWGSVIIKFVIVNPSDSVTQTIPFKAFLPKEVRQEYIIDLGGLMLNYDATTEQYYVTAEITLEKGESVIRSVKIKDIWVISEDEIASLRQQAEDLYEGLKKTPYSAQALILRTDINTRLDRVVRKQKDGRSTPQEHILAYRENAEDMKAINENIKGLKDLVLTSGVGSNFLASIGGIQTFATWGIVLVLIFGMGTLGMFYYQLWRRKVVTVSSETRKKTKKIEISTPSPFMLPGFDLAWLKKILFGWLILIRDIFANLIRLIKLFNFQTKSTTTKAKITQKTLIVFLMMGGTVVAIISGIVVTRNFLKKNQDQNTETRVTTSMPNSTLVATREERVEVLVAEMIERATEKKETHERIEELTKESEEEGVLRATFEYQQLLVIKQTPNGWVDVRQEPSLSAEIITKVYPGESYPFSETEGEWYKILLKDLTEGWIPAKFVKPEEKITNAVGDIFVEIIPPEGGGVNIRQSADKESKIIKTVYVKNKYLKLGEEGDWIKIELLGGKAGFVFKEFIQTISE